MKWDYDDRMIEKWRKGARKYNFLHFLYNATHPKPYCSSPPHQIYIEVTNRCNLNCLHCPRSTMRRGSSSLNIKLFEKVIRELTKFMPFVDLYMQGEALIHKDIVEMVRMCRSYGLLPRITTNATLLNKMKATRLIDAGLEKIEFSWSGASVSSYEKMHHGCNIWNHNC